MEDMASSVTRKSGALRVVSLVIILFSFAAGIAANRIGEGWLRILLWCASLGLLFLGFLLLFVYHQTLLVIRQPSDLAGQLEVKSQASERDDEPPGTLPLTQEAEKRIDLLFEPKYQEMVRTILMRDCGNNLWRKASETEIDRLRFAVLKVSRGSLDRLTGAIELAKIDWRDVLLAAGFANNPQAHRSWLPKRNW
jgi:hypothetical protein